MEKILLSSIAYLSNVKDFMKPILIILMGAPGSGKSTLCKNSMFANHVRISQDDMGKNMHRTHYKEAIENRENIILDKTNFLVEGRRTFITEAKEAGYLIVGVTMETDYETCVERVRKRTNHKFSSSQKKIESCVVGVGSWFKQFEKPSKEEGFDEIVTVSSLLEGNIPSNNAT